MKSLTICLLLIGVLHAITRLAVAGQVGEPQIQLQTSAEVPSLYVADDLQVELVAREPAIANPLYLNFDEQGRLWVVEYRQYPWPAGLKLISRDSVWRNVYQPPFPPPPPHAIDSPFRGQDRISVFQDVDGDGHFEGQKIFLDGLNLATAALVGRGGVYVMNPPYFLYYEDRDRDAIADSEKPRILLSGFGIEDSHSIANSLRWGPDGWIYGAQGSTVSASVVLHGADNLPIPGQRPIHTMGQHLWRYHPESHRFEIFAEGGGNAFGVEFDSMGRVYSGHNGGDTRGFYYVPGGYYLKNFGKHGSHSNPYTFGHYNAMRHPPVERFTHTFEIYEADSLPERYRGNLFALAPHLHYVICSQIRDDGSSRQTSDIGKVLVPGKEDRDDWFTPVDIQTGPDGSLYIADWYAVQVNHYHSHEGQTNPDLGRLYRLRSIEKHWESTIDLAALSSTQLIEQYLFHRNRWYRETALRLLGDRKDLTIVPLLKQQLGSSDEIIALNAMWALHQVGGLDEATHCRLLQHTSSHVRCWSVRLLGERENLEPGTLEQIVACSRSDANVAVRLQLACTARSLPPETALKVISQLCVHSEDVGDPLIPKALWWAIEVHADRHDLIIDWASQSERWFQPLVEEAALFPNLARRFALQGSQADLRAVASLMRVAPNEIQLQRVVGGFSAAFAGRVLPPLPAELVGQLARVSGPYAIILGLRQRDPDAFDRADRWLEQSEDIEIRSELLKTLGEVRVEPERTVPLLLACLRARPTDKVGAAALHALQFFENPEIAAELLGIYSELSPSLQESTQSILASREKWAGMLLKAISLEAIAARDIVPDVVDRLRLYQDAEIHALTTRWFPIVAVSDEQMDMRMTAIERIILGAQGNPLAGQDLFHGSAGCGKCHAMFGKGGEVGPDLTNYNRNQIRMMLLAIINPNAEIREGFENLTISTLDGRIVSGFKVDENDHAVTLRTADGQTVTFARDNIDELKPNRSSLMPSGLLDRLSDEQIRNLFAFLASTTPPL